MAQRKQTEGHRLMKALSRWLGTDEGKRCLAGAPSGKYLENRLSLAFLEGWARGQIAARNTTKRKAKRGAA